MSDVHTSSTWSTVASEYKGYTTTLTFYAYDGNNDTLCAIQQTPPTAGSNLEISTYLKGLEMSQGYDGKLIKTHAVVNDPANMTQIVYYIANKSSGYDITGNRCYVQFRNTHTGSNALPITSWSLETDDGTVIASGGNITAGGYLEIDFINDYDTVNFKLITNLTGTPSSVGHWLYIPYGDSTMPLEPTAYNYEASDGLYHIHCDIPNGVFITCKGTSGNTTDFYVGTMETSAPADVGTTFIRIGYYTYYNSESWNAFIGDHAATTSGGYIYRDSTVGWIYQFGQFLKNCLTYNGYYGYTSVSDAMTALYGTPFGYNTANLNNAMGTLLQCNMFADISQTFPGASNEVQGGTLGTFDNSTDTNPLPALPTADQTILDSDGKSIGAFSIFKLTESEYQYVRKCLFSTDVLQNIKNFFARPIDGIISLGRLPFDPAGVTSTRPIYIGSVSLEHSGVPATGIPVNRYYSFNCGSVSVLPYWDTALDYNPYTSITLNLPFIGKREINTDLVMGKTINLTYHVDIITGCCVAYIVANGDLLYQFTGNMLTTAPLSGEDFSRVYGALLTSVASAAVSATMSGSPMGGLANAVTGSANAALHSKREFAGNVNMGGSTSFMENMQPYIEIIRPIQSRPRDYNTFKGYVSTITQLLNDCSGYTEVLDVHLENISATDGEKDEIITLLRTGVII